MEIAELLRAYPLLSMAQTAFMVWMLVDAYRRGAEFFWYWVIFLLPVIGAWAYFFAVKVSDFQGMNLGLGSLFQSRAPLEELEYHVQKTPTLTNRMALAERLMEASRYPEAVPHLEAVLKQEPDHPPALYRLAACHKAQADLDQAIGLLEKVTARDIRWSDFRALRLLIECRSQAGNSAGAIDACRDLARLSPLLQHQCMLAELLVAAGHSAEARTLLDRALQEHAFAPRMVRRRDRRWAGVAERLLKQMPAD